MYAAPDRGIRMALLEMLPSYVDRLTKKIVNDQIFPHVVSCALKFAANVSKSTENLPIGQALGFTDGVPMIREQTIKGILLLVPMVI